jgi:hypothetical protein
MASSRQRLRGLAGRHGSGSKSHEYQAPGSDTLVLEREAPQSNVRSHA